MYTVHNCKPLLVFIQTEFRFTNKPIQNVLPTREHKHIELDRRRRRIQIMAHVATCSVCVRVNIIIILYSVAPA